MLTKKEKVICDKYSKEDDHHRTHCNECPLEKGDNFKCKAWCHYDLKTRKWVEDGRMGETGAASQRE